MSEHDETSEDPKPKPKPVPVATPEPVKAERLSEGKLLAEELGLGGGAGPESGRRDFLQKAGSVVIGGAIVAAPVAVAVTALIDPLRRGKQGGVMARLTSLEALIPGGPPQAFKVIADKTDAWTTYQDLPLGLVYVQRNEDGSLKVFSASCPHAGCAVEYRNTADDGEHYYCPCHESSFLLDGSLGPKNTQAKRGLDTLEIDQEKLTEGEVWVKFQRFKAGIPEKQAVS